MNWFIDTTERITDDAGDELEHGDPDYPGQEDPMTREDPVSPETNCALCDRRIREQPDGTWRAVPTLGTDVLQPRPAITTGPDPMTREDPVRAAARHVADMDYGGTRDDLNAALDDLRAALAASAYGLNRGEQRVATDDEMRRIRKLRGSDV